MLCEEIMKRNVECVSPDDTAQSAARRMLDENVGFLPVCEESKKVIGTVTDRDLAIRLVAGGLPGNSKIGEIMTREVVSCAPKDDIQKAEKLMGQNHKSRIMCVEDGRLVGVISLSDIAQKDQGRAGQTLAEVTTREAHA
jgi:CBS domain-containing protein